MEPIAYAAGLLPWQFWRLTPAEFQSWMTGYEARLARERYLVAWQTAYLLRAWVLGKKGRSITPEKLLGIKKKRDETPEQLSARMTREFMKDNP